MSNLKSADQLLILDLQRDMIVLPADFHVESTIFEIRLHEFLNIILIRDLLTYFDSS